MIQIIITMSKKYLISGFIISATIAFPLMTYAKTSTLASLISTIVGYFNIILDLMMGVAVVMFVFYVIKYFMLPTDNRTEAWQYVLWALVGFFVIFSMWGLVNILTNTFNLGNNTPPSWSSISNIFPSGDGSSGSNNVFNQSVPSYNSLPSQNYSSGYTSGGSSGSNYNPFGSSMSNVNHSSGGNGSANRTSSKGAASTANSGSGTTKGVCSKYFNICISNSSGARGTILKDSDQDFDLLDQKDGIMIGLISSKELSFNGSGGPFTNVSLLGQKISAYKRSTNGVTQVITGTQTNGATLIVMLVSKNDITASRASAIIGSINLNK
jgi:hypothetical protein